MIDRFVAGGTPCLEEPTPGLSRPDYGLRWVTFTNGIRRSSIGPMQMIRQRGGAGAASRVLCKAAISHLPFSFVSTREKRAV